MRRLIAVAALLCLAACTDSSPTASDDKTTPGGSPGAAATATATPLPSTAGVPGGADKATICAAYLKAEGEAGAKFIEILPKAAEAMSDPGKAPGVLTELKAALKTYEAALAAEAARTADGHLKAAIDADLATIKATMNSVEASGNDMEKVLNALNSPEFQKLGDTVKTLCEK